MLQVEQPKALFALEQGHVRQLAFIELKALGIRCSLAWLAIDDEYARDLRQLSEDDLVLVFDRSDDSIR